MKKMGTELFFIYKKKIREEEDEEKLHWITKLHKKKLSLYSKEGKIWQFRSQQPSKTSLINRRCTFLI
jgi:hypothetical protein